MEEELDTESATFFWEVLTPGEVISIESLWNKINRAPQLAEIYYITRACSDIEDFEYFLRDYPGHFYVENGRVTRSDSRYVNVRTRAVEYYETILEDHYQNHNPHYMNFRGHIGQAERDVIDFINTFYPDESFKNFLLSNSGVFTVFTDGTVSLIERESVDYFITSLEDYGGGKSYVNFRGHIAQAPKYIQKYINTYYPVKNFIVFLQSNSDVFVVFPDDTVSLIEPVCVDYFKIVLENYVRDLNYMSLRSFTDQAQEHIDRYINDCYPGESFVDFLESNKDVFVVFSDDTVSLVERESVNYFESVLENYAGGLDYMNLRGYIDRAPDYVEEYINDCYAGESFVEFLLSNNNRFVVFTDDTVSLVESESVEYFKNVLDDHGDGLNYTRLRRHVEKAKGYVKDFINGYYPGKKFLNFLRNNDDVFDVHRKTVYLVT